MKTQTWNVIDSNGNCIDEVPYDVDCDADYVKRSLIDHDGYDPGIGVYASGVIPDDLQPEYSARFEPQADLPAKLNECRVKWSITLTRNGATMVVPYSTGIGHLKGYRQGERSANYGDSVRTACRTGHSPRMAKFRVAAVEPKLADVLHCLLVASDVLDYSRFEDWAAEFGYDSDSRTAERTYQQCLQQSLQFRQLYSDSERETLRHVFANY